MSNRPTNSVLPTILLLAVSGKAGLDVAALCALVELDMALLQDPDRRLPTAVNERLLAEVVRLTGDEFFWVRPMLHDEGAKENAAWYIFFNSKNLEEALTRGGDLYRLMSDVTYPALYTSGKECVVRLSARIPNHNWSPFLIDWAMSGWMSMIKTLVGLKFKLIEVRLTQSSTEREKPYKDYYQAPVRFAQPYNEMVFDSSLLSLPNVEKEVDGDLQNLLLRLAHPESRKPPPEDDFESTMRDMIQHELINSRPTLEVIAKRMASNPRSIQRKLAKINMTFSDLVQDTLRSLAATYLKNPNLNISDVAYLLGFKDIRSLNTAFQRWHGVTPSAYKKENTTG